MTLGRAIDRAMKASSLGKQDLLAAALGIDQTAVSKMINGKVSVTVERVREIEDLCGVERGQILRWAGYVAESAEEVRAVVEPHRGTSRVAPQAARAIRRLGKEADGAVEPALRAAAAQGQASAEEVAEAVRRGRSRPRPPVEEDS